MSMHERIRFGISRLPTDTYLPAWLPAQSILEAHLQTIGRPLGRAPILYPRAAEPCYLAARQVMHAV